MNWTTCQNSVNSVNIIKMEPWILLFITTWCGKHSIKKWMDEWMSDKMWIQYVSFVSSLFVGDVSIRYRCDFVIGAVIIFSTETEWEKKKKNESLNGTNQENRRVCSTWHYCAVKRITCDILLCLGGKPEKPYCSVFCVLYRTLHVAAMPKQGTGI